jgi:hypothetical protein
LEFEHLPPSWGNSTGESDVGWSSIRLDFHGIVLPLLRSNCLAALVEVELLSNSVLGPSSELDIVSSNTFSNSLHWQSWDKIEWSSNVETEFLVQSRCWLFVLFVKINNLPSLVSTFMKSVNDNSLTFYIFSSGNIKYFSVSDVHKVFSFIDESLEPSWVGAPDLHVSSFSSRFDVEW